MSAIQSERKPFHRFPSLENSPMFSSVLSRLVQLRRVAHHASPRFLPEEFEDLLHFELLLVAGADHFLLLRNALLHHRLQFGDLVLVLLDTEIAFAGYILRIRRPG